MENNIEVRKIEKKTWIWIGIIIIIGFCIFMIVENSKSIKAEKVLHELGFTQVSDVKVYSVTQVENIDTKIQGYKYFVKFQDLKTNKECKGFILKDFKHNVDKDLICK